MDEITINNLQQGASDESLNSLEQVLNVKLPLDFIQFYKLHDGQYAYSEGLIDGEELLCINRILEEWKIWSSLVNEGYFSNITSSPDYGVKNDWYNLKWIPITSDGSGNNYCLDLDPTYEGSYGQIIRLWHDDPARNIESKSFLLFLDKYLSRNLG